MVTGDTVNTAARLEQAAAPGEILIGSSTYELVRDAVTADASQPLEVKGKATTVPAYRLLDVTPGAAGVSRRLDSPMVGASASSTCCSGRSSRRRRIRRVTSSRSSALAGVGKSRLEQELVERIGDRGDGPPGPVPALRRRDHVLPGGRGREAGSRSGRLRRPGLVESKVCAVLEGDDIRQLACERLAQLLGVSSAAPDETFWAIRRMVEAVARARPLLLVFDDIHWGEATFLDLVEHIADWSRDAPILLLCLSRPELLDRRPVPGAAGSGTRPPTRSSPCPRGLPSAVGEPARACRARTRA